MLPITTQAEGSILFTGEFIGLVDPFRGDLYLLNKPDR